MWIAVALAVIVGIGFIFAPKKKDVPAKYEKAKKAYEEGNIVEACSLMDEVLIFSISEKYTYEESRQIIKSLELLKQLCKAQNLNKDVMIDPIIKEFAAISQEGGKVSDSVTKEVEAFVEKIVDFDSLAKTLVSEAENGNINGSVEDSERDFTDDISSESERAIINQVGKYLIKGDTKAGIAFINENLPEEMGALKANLLDQKAALYFMDGQINEAVELYREILSAFPENNRIKTSLAEGLDKLGIADEAVALASSVARNTRDKELSKTVKKILDKHKK